MQLKNLNLLFLFTTLLFFACSEKSNLTGSQNPDLWSIPSDEVFSGGPGKDGIPSVDSPNFISPAEVNFLNNEDLVVGIVVNDEARAYPHEILDWHEIVNDDIGDVSVALTYCPLTGTAIGWNRNVNGMQTTFGVSGKLYNTNLIPYDRQTDSYWSQISMSCVNGELINTVIETYPVIETTWGTWKAMYPNTKVMNTDTGFNRNYGQYPYGDYRTNHNNIIFPVNPKDDRLPAKERVLGVLENGSNKAFSINEFETPKVIEENIGGRELVIIGSKTDNFIVAFYNNGLNNLSINFDNFPVIAIDEAGNQLDISGKIVAGPLANSTLESPTAFIGYWFSFGAFYPGIGLN